MPRSRKPPVGDYDEMAGWPGTISPSRLRRALAAIRDRVTQDELDPETNADVTGMVHAHAANMFSSLREEDDDPPGTGTEAQGQETALQSWERTVARARGLDTPYSIGGVIVWKRGDREDSAVFQLLRNPQWMGLNRILPEMAGMKITMFDSRTLPGRPGIVVAESSWDSWQRSSRKNAVPEGEAAFLRDILSWHGGSEFNWVTEQNG